MGLIVYLLYIVQHIVFMCGILNVQFRIKWMRVAISVVALSLARLLQVYCAYNNSSFDLVYVLGVYVMPTIGVVSLFDKPFIKNVVKYWFAAFYIDIFYMPINALVSAVCDILEPNVNDNLAIIIEAIMVLGAIWGVSYLLKENKRVAEWIKKVPTGYFVIAILCGGAASGIGSYLEFAVKDTNDRAQSVMSVLIFAFKMSVYLMCIGFAVTDYFRKRYKEEGIMKDQYLRMSKEHYVGLAAHMQEIRRLKHDMKAHISVINKYAEDGNLEQLKKYVGELTEEHMKQNVGIINTGNELVDAIISDGVSKGYGRDIVIDCMGELSGDIGISDFDWCTIFYNLLANAMEACDKLTASEKKICIRLKNTNDEVRIVFENPVEWDVNVEALGTYTSKSDKENHGFGISNIRSTVEKYDGNMAMSAENGVFKTVIIFYK